MGPSLRGPSAVCKYLESTPETYLHIITWNYLEDPVPVPSCWKNHPEHVNNLVPKSSQKINATIIVINLFSEADVWCYMAAVKQTLQCPCGLPRFRPIIKLPSFYSVVPHLLYFTMSTSLQIHRETFSHFQDFASSEAGDLRRHLKTHRQWRKVKKMQPMWLCIFSYSLLDCATNLLYRFTERHFHTSKIHFAKPTHLFTFLRNPSVIQSRRE